MSRYGTCVHECAHAIAALSFGRPIASIAVESDGSGAFRISATTPARSHEAESAAFHGLCATLVPQDRGWCEQQLTIDLVGGVAQARIDGTAIARHAAAIDLERASAMASAVGSPWEARTLLDQARRKAERLVDEHWHAIQAVARELDRRGRLSERDVWCILGRVASGPVRIDHAPVTAMPVVHRRRWSTRRYYQGPLVAHW